MQRDEAYLLDILTAARKILNFTSGMTEDDFRNSELHQLAVIRLIQIMGDASRKISEEFKNTHPDIKWAEIAGMRNHVVHQYASVKLHLVWGVVHTDATELIEQLEPLIPPPDDLSH